MPVTLTPQGFVLRVWDPASKEMVILAPDAPGFMVLSEHIEIQPRTTVGNLFDVIERDEMLKALLTHACFCDLEELHSRYRNPDSTLPIEVHSKGDFVEGVVRFVTAKRLLIHRRISAHKYKNDLSLQLFIADIVAPLADEAEIEPHEMAMGSGFKLTNNVHLSDSDFGAICGLELNLEDRVLFSVDMPIYAEDEEDDQPGVSIDEAIPHKWTVLDFVLAVYRCFGARSIDRRSLADIEADEREELRFFEEHEDDDDESD